MVNYELLYLTPLQENDADRIVVREQVANVIQSSGGSVIAAREFVRQRLSFPIKRQQAGEYALVDFTAPGKAIRDMERELRLLPAMLRCLVTVKSEKARAVGREIDALERARAQSDAVKAARERATETADEGAPPKAIEDLDKKLEEILGKDMV